MTIMDSCSLTAVENVSSVRWRISGASSVQESSVSGVFSSGACGLKLDVKIFFRLPPFLLLFDCD